MILVNGVLLAPPGMFGFGTRVFTTVLAILWFAAGVCHTKKYRMRWIVTVVTVALSLVGMMILVATL